MESLQKSNACFRLPEGSDAIVASESCWGATSDTKDAGLQTQSQTSFVAAAANPAEILHIQAQQAAVRAQQRQQKQQRVLLLQQTFTQQRQAAGTRHSYAWWRDSVAAHPQEHASNYHQSICVIRRCNAFLSKQLFSIPMGLE